MRNAQNLKCIHAEGFGENIYKTSLKLTTVGKQGNDTRIFDLQGVEHDTMQRGINIMSGKKIVKK